MDYYKYEVKNSPELTEALVAFFSALPFDTFQENGEGFEAYLPAKDFSADIEGELHLLKSRFEFFFPERVH